MRILAAAIAVLAVGGCAGHVSDVEPEAPASISGLYRQGFEQSDFYPAKGGGPWWLTYDGDLWSKLEPFVQGSGRGLAAVVRFEVIGEVSEPGRFGHLGAYERELVVERIVSVTGASEAEFEAAARLASMASEAD